MAGIDALMVTEMVTAAPDEMVAEVARRMSRNRVGAVLVVEGNVLHGLFSERDLLTRVVQENRDPQATRVGDVATRTLHTIDVGAPLKEVLDVFRQKKFRHLPVVRGGTPVGILSTRDFLEYLVDGLEHYIDQLKYKRELAEGIDPYDHVGGSYGK
ncbi:MAG TPA: CBS domain-containing protein [Candidatus Margulisiibacteriota bacterium]|nr:CBS domain-containing protein [Candidatus Margulisiibacteriota bacterium]